jgi:hypothetical protein
MQKMSIWVPMKKTFPKFFLKKKCILTYSPNIGVNPKNVIVDELKDVPFRRFLQWIKMEIVKNNGAPTFSTPSIVQRFSTIPIDSFLIHS